MPANSVGSLAHVLGLMLLVVFLSAALGVLTVAVVGYVVKHSVRSLLALFDPRRYARIAWLRILERYGNRTSVWRVQHKRMAGDSEHKTRDPDYEWPKK